MRDRLQSALEHHNAGNLAQAERLYREILEVDPDNIPALHLLGVVFSQSGNYDLAIEHIKKALRLNQNNPDAYNHLGSALKAKGHLEEAILCYQKSIELNPNLTEAYFNLGNALIAKGNIDESVTYYQMAVALKPNFLAAYYNLGKAFQDKGNPDEAMISYQKALELNPHSADIYDAIGTILQEKGQLDEAMSYFKKAIELNPEFPCAHGNLGKNFQEKGCFEEALTHYRKATQLASDRTVLSNLYNNMGVVYQEKGQFQEALDYYQKALELDADQAGIYKNLGTLFHDGGLFDDAIDHYRKALELAPDDAETYCNLGSVSEDKGLLDEARIFYQKALEIDSGLAEAHWNISLLDLLSGNFEEGWKGYEWRLLKKDAKTSCFLQPQWDGSSLKGKSLVVSAEQGVGDEIMFASCLAEVISQADLCIVESDKRLIPLFARSFPKAKVIESMNSVDACPADLPKADIRIAIGSLPKFFRPDVSSFVQQSGYLKPHDRKIEIWRRRLSELGAGFKIGISWRGGSKPSVKLARSTVLEQWMELFSFHGVHFINLQYGDCAKELREVKEKMGTTIHHWEDADPLKDLDGFAAQVSALDLVISIDNSTVHMAGAVGTPVWALLPYACDWRWMRKFEDTPWYKTVRLFRQRKPGDWNEVFDRAASALKQYIETGFMPRIDPSDSYTSHLKAARDGGTPSSFLPVIHSSTKDNEDK